MELSRPGADLLGATEAALLMRLSLLTKGASGRHLERLAGLTSHSSAQRALARLVVTGLVEADYSRAATLYTLNRGHIFCAPVLEILRSPRRVLDEITAIVTRAGGPDVTAALFGSVARGESTRDSDIDVALVFPDGTADEVYEAVADDLHESILALTGNVIQVLDLSASQLAGMVEGGAPLVDSWRADAVELCGPSFLRMLSRAAA